jgi:hypothetical protein
MAITTIYDPEHYSTTSTKIIKEFIETYISNVLVKTDMPLLDEAKPLTKPIIYLEPMNGASKNIGMGRVGKNGREEEKQVVSIWCKIIVCDTIGGQPKARELGETLKYMFFKPDKRVDLAKAGLRNPKCSSLRELPRDNQSIFHGGRCLITAEVSIY